jgi:hypothetical protein
MGFLDDSNFHRSYWVYGKSFAGGHGGYYQAGKYAPAGRILVHDDKNVYSYGREAQYYKWTTTMEYTLFSTPKSPPEESFTTDGATTERKGNSLVLGPDGQPLTNQPPALEKNKKGAAKGPAKGDGKKKGKGKAAPAVAVLLTGDGAGYESGVGFHADLERMAKKGWGVEVLSWEHSCNKRLRKWATGAGVFILLDKHYDQITFIERGRTVLPRTLIKRKMAQVKPE